MSDVLIRTVPERVLSAIDARAARLGLSRSELVRRGLAQWVDRSTSSVVAADLERFSSTFEDLADPSTSRQAWS
ncbi:MAG: ribbon-helix-helix domain-containing protein [Candidatus Nanopelagicales bacterium]|nr:ribbon-helix-helix domain-containing protein [Candidatus Nanopelagicales bacterium]